MKKKIAFVSVITVLLTISFTIFVFADSSTNSNPTSSKQSCCLSSCVNDCNCCETGVCECEKCSCCDEKKDKVDGISKNISFNKTMDCCK